MPCVLLTELKTGEPQKGALILSSLISVWCKVTPSQAHLMHPRADEPQEERRAPGRAPVLTHALVPLGFMYTSQTQK